VCPIPKNRTGPYPAASRNERANHAEKLPARACVCVMASFFYTYVRYERTFYRCAAPPARDREWCAVRWCLASPALNLLLSAMCVRAR
jgi:hypothetical protein